MTLQEISKWHDISEIRRYHIPQHFLKPRDNLLVLVEEMGGDPLQITVNTMSITTVCGNVNELSAPALDTHGRGPEVQLQCQKGKHISAIEFASYGSPAGNCTTFSTGSCHAESSESVVKQVTQHSLLDMKCHNLFPYNN
jgi:hypothetical protein